MRPEQLEVDNPLYLRDLEARDAAGLAADEEGDNAVFSLEEKVGRIPRYSTAECGGTAGVLITVICVINVPLRRFRASPHSFLVPVREFSLSILNLFLLAF